MQIDIAKVRRELEEVAHPDMEGSRHIQRAELIVKLDYQGRSKVGVDEWERSGKFGFTVRLNPHRIHTQKQLEEAVGWAKQQL